MPPSPADLRAYYAQFVAGKAGTSDARLIAALSAVPRERFVGAGPWKVMAYSTGYIETPSDDLAWLYQDVVVALNAERQINNGEPSLHARSLASLGIRTGETVIHIGAGTGYYTAILSHMVGDDGRVVAYEIDRELACRAEANLEDWPHVVVEHRSGAAGGLPVCDVIYVSAGATRPLDTWLDVLQVGGRLLFPLTPPARAVGGMLLVVRTAAASFDARFVQPAAFIPCDGARNDEEAELLAGCFARCEMR